jgi:eukaryotic-like serine/threonine-protein kinase
MRDPIDTKKQTPVDVERIGLHPAPLARFAPGDRVPHGELWVLGEKLGQGGFGEVWLAVHQVSGARRAVKFCTHPAARNRLAAHEVKIVRHVLKHLTDHAGEYPHIVPLLECNLTGDAPWLMYEYVPGKRTLADVIREFGPLAPERRLAGAVPLLHALAGAIAAMHAIEVPIVHRDLKPANVLMDGAVPRITDFGIGGAAVVAAISDSTGGYTEMSVGLPTLIQGPRVGTLLYASPEQWQGAPPDPRNDIYALGVIAYQMALGDLHAVPGSDARDELDDLGVPGELAALVARSISSNPERRPKRATDWCAALAPWLPGAPAVPPVVPVAPAPRPAGTRACAVNVPGVWYARAAATADTVWRESGWREVTRVPGEVTAGPGEVYRLVLADTATDDDLAELEPLRAVPALRSLDLTGCKLVTDAGIERACALHALQALDLSNTLVTDLGIACLKELSALRSLGLANCKRVTNRGLAQLGAFQFLRVLDLHGCRRLTDAGVSQLKRIRTLKLLDLRGCDDLTPAGVSRLRKALPNCVVET